MSKICPECGGPKNRQTNVCRSCYLVKHSRPENYIAKIYYQIAENLGEIWQLNREQTSEVLNAELKKEEQELLESLDEFDFGDFDDL